MQSIHRTIMAAVLMATAFFAFGALPTYAEKDEALLAHLSKVADSAIHAQLGALTLSVSASSVDSTLYAEAVQSMVVEYSNLRAILREAGIAHNEYESELIDLSMEIIDDKAIVYATEHTILPIESLDPEVNVPEATEYLHDHKFTFRLFDGTWILESDELINLFGSDNPTNDVPPLTDLSLQEKLYLPILPGNNIIKVDASSLNIPLGINRNDVVDYANQYWTDYNPDYRDYSGAGNGGDCTNYVSQALYAGGMTEVWDWGPWTWNPRDPNQWWYRWYGQTRSWVNVGDFYTFVINQGKGRNILDFDDYPPTSTLTGVELGDVLQANWNNDTVWDHTMIVTYGGGGSMPYLNWHSNDTRFMNLHSLMWLVRIRYQAHNAAYRFVHIY